MRTLRGDMACRVMRGANRRPSAPPTAGDTASTDDPKLAVWLTCVDRRLARALLNRGTTAEALAKNLEISVELLRGITTETSRDLDLELMWQIADALCVNIADLLAEPGKSRLDSDDQRLR
jgi:type VI protein secretion system component VasA